MTTDDASGDTMKDRLSDRFVGTWRLVSFVCRRADGRETATFGAAPRGYLMYDAGGRMAVQIARSEAPGAPPAENAPGAHFGYFGTWAVDESAGVVTHRVEGASDPDLAGTEQRRYLTWQGNRLVLSTARESDGADVTYAAVWERLA